MRLLHPDLTPRPRKVRVFGLSLAATALLVVLAIAGGAPHELGPSEIVGSVFLVVGIAVAIGNRHALSRRLFTWFSLPALLLGNALGLVVATVAFYLVVTPIGLLRRLFGHRRRLSPSESTWIEVPPSERDGAGFERQF